MSCRFAFYFYTTSFYRDTAAQSLVALYSIIDNTRQGILYTAIGSWATAAPQDALFEQEFLLNIIRAINEGFERTTLHRNAAAPVISDRLTEAIKLSVLIVERHSEAPNGFWEEVQALVDSGGRILLSESQEEEASSSDNSGSTATGTTFADTIEAKKTLADANEMKIEETEPKMEDTTTRTETETGIEAVDQDSVTEAAMVYVPSATNTATTDGEVVTVVDDDSKNQSAANTDDVAGNFTTRADTSTNQADFTASDTSAVANANPVADSSALETGPDANNSRASAIQCCSHVEKLYCCTIL